MGARLGSEAGAPVMSGAETKAAEIAKAKTAARAAEAKAKAEIAEAVRTARLALLGECWRYVRWLVLVVLIVTPAIMQAVGDNGSSFHSLFARLWFAPLMGLFAGVLPSSGAPIAGGIVFFPILSMSGLCGQDSVAFLSATQFLLCGVFTPLNWLLTDPTVLRADVFRLALLPGSIGLTLAFVLEEHLDQPQFVLWLFLAFVIVNLVYTLQGLICDNLSFEHESEARSDATSSSERTQSAQESARMERGHHEVKEGGDQSIDRSISGRAAQCLSDFPRAYTDVAPTWFLLVSYSLVVVVGGVLVGVIGIGIENVLFCVVTWGARGIHVRDASISSVVVVGWLSGISMIVHAVSPRCPAEPGYKGAIPIDLLLMTLPGVLMGSLLGPTVAKLLGARNVIWLFCLCLVGDAVENSLRLSGFMGDTCRPVGARDCMLWCQAFPPYMDSSSYSERPIVCLALVNGSTYNATWPHADKIKDPAAIDRNASMDDGDVDVSAVSFDGPGSRVRGPGSRVHAVPFDGRYYFDGMQHIDLFSGPECCQGFGARDAPAQSTSPPWAAPTYAGHADASEARSPINARAAEFKVQSDGWVPAGAHRIRAAVERRVRHATTLLPG